MKTIYKYILKPNELDLMLPTGSKVLSAGWQGNDIFIWVLHDTIKLTVNHKFAVIGTGWCIPEHDFDKLCFIDTVFTPDGLVFHVFEVK